MEKDSRIFPKLVKSSIAGTAGGMSSVLIGQPFDIVKIRMQAQCSINPIYRTPLHWIKAILYNEGWRAFYKGTSAPLMSAGICTSIRFWANEASKKLFKRYNERRKKHNPHILSSAQLAICGAFAGMANSPVTTPIEHARILLQNQNSLLDPRLRFRGSFDAIRRVFKEYGFRDVYRGYSITVVRDGIFSAVFFGIYDIMKCKTTDPTKRPNLPWLMLLGSVWGVISWIPSYPFDVVKTKIQLEPFRAPFYKSYWDCFKKVYHKEGIKGFTMGLGTCLVRTTITSSTVIGVFELTLRYLEAKTHGHKVTVRP